eukprot:2593347-Prymnesium_polylepis.1
MAPGYESAGTTVHSAADEKVKVAKAQKKEAKAKKMKKEAKAQKASEAAAKAEAEQAEAFAAKMAAKKEAAQKKKDKQAEETKEPGGEDTNAAAGVDNAPAAVDNAPAAVDIEGRLNSACASAKKAHKADPDNADLLARYEAAKAAFSSFQQRKGGKKRKDPPGKIAKPMDADTELWTCELCQTTISIRADGNAKQQHLEGKKHLKKATAAEATAAAPEAAPAAAGEMFSCSVCVCTVAASAREAHEN